jgi:predicted nicotinamide N-methyase
VPLLKARAAGPDDAALVAFIRANTVLVRPPLLPEIALHLATEVTPLWEATEAALDRIGLPPPYWAFAWVGGQAVARHILDTPEIVAGRRVLDLACGCGTAAIAAAMAGAAAVTARDIDRVALMATALNAAGNGVAVATVAGDPVGEVLAGVDVVLAGDVCYEKPMTDRVVPWLRILAAAGKVVLIGDPGRAYLLKGGLLECARFAVPTTMAIEDRAERETVVWQVLAKA